MMRRKCRIVIRNSEILLAVLIEGNPDAKRLYDEILSGYNKLVRPVKNVTDPVTVKFKLKLSQLIDVVSSLEVIGTIS